VETYVNLNTINCCCCFAF